MYMSRAVLVGLYVCYHLYFHVSVKEMIGLLGFNASVTARVISRR